MSTVRTNVQVCSEVLHFSCGVVMCMRYHVYWDIEIISMIVLKKKTCMSTNSDSYVDVAAFMPVALSQQQRCADGVGC